MAYSIFYVIHRGPSVGFPDPGRGWRLKLGSTATAGARITPTREIQIHGGDQSAYLIFVTFSPQTIFWAIFSPRKIYHFFSKICNFPAKINYIVRFSDNSSHGQIWGSQFVARTVIGRDSKKLEHRGCCVKQKFQIGEQVTNLLLGTGCNLGSIKGSWVIISAETVA